MIWKILGLFVNTLHGDDKYSLLSRDNLMQPINAQLSKKQKAFWEFFSVFLKSTFNFEHFQKKDDPHSWYIFENTVSKKRRLDKYLKSPVSEDYSKSNMVNQPKHSWNLHDSTFIIFIDHCEGNSVGKSLS